MTDDLIEQPVMVQELLAMSKRELVSNITLERIPDIEVRVAIVCRRIEGVLPVRSAGVASPARRVKIVHEVRPCVVEAEVESIAHALLNHSLQRVVV